MIRRTIVLAFRRTIAKHVGMKRADLAKRRFLSWATHWASNASGSLEERAQYGFERTLSEAERGGSGIGVATFRRAERERSKWLPEIIARVGGTP